MPSKRVPAAPRDAALRIRTAGRRDALTALYEAEFGLRSAAEILNRRADAGEVEGEPLLIARALIELVEAQRPGIDAALVRLAPAFPLATMRWYTRARRRLRRHSQPGRLWHARTAASRHENW